MATLYYYPRTGNGNHSSLTSSATLSILHNPSIRGGTTSYKARFFKPLLPEHVNNALSHTLPRMEKLIHFSISPGIPSYQTILIPYTQFVIISI